MPGYAADHLPRSAQRGESAHDVVLPATPMQGVRQILQKKTAKSWGDDAPARFPGGRLPTPGCNPIPAPVTGQLEPHSTFSFCGSTIRHPAFVVGTACDTLAEPWSWSWFREQARAEFPPRLLHPWLLRFVQLLPGFSVRFFFGHRSFLSGCKQPRPTEDVTRAVANIERIFPLHDRPPADQRRAGAFPE